MSPVDRAAPVRVLVVDDDDDQRLLLRRLLAREGFEDVVEATDGDGAVHAAMAHDPDLVLLDLSMPGRSGTDVLPELRRQAPKARVVILSNAPRQRMAEIVQHHGAVGYVEKRVPADRLVHEVLMAAALSGQTADRVSTHLPPLTTAAGEARRFVRDALGTADQALLADVELLVSELVTNAVLHASSSPQVDVILEGAHIRVEVHDDDPSLPRALEPDDSAPGGRGLLLLDRIASRWGADPHGKGKLMWFELDRASTSPQPGAD